MLEQRRLLVGNSSHCWGRLVLRRQQAIKVVHLPEYARGTLKLPREECRTKYWRAPRRKPHARCASAADPTVSLILTTLSLALHFVTIIYVDAIGLLVDLQPHSNYGSDRRRLQTGPGRFQEAAQARRESCLCLHYAFRPPK